MMKRILLVVAIAIISGATSQAQLLSRGDLFGPGAPPAMIGVELGLGMHSQVGTYQAACNCEFTNGSQSGFLGGLLFEVPFSYEWTVGIGAKFDFGGLNNTTIVKDEATIRFEGSDSATTSTIPFQRNGIVKLTTLVLNPFVKYEFYRGGPFVAVGPGIGLVLSNSFTHTRELFSSSITLNDGQTINGVTFENGTNTEDLEPTAEMKDVNKLQLALMLTAGYDIHVSDNSVVAPMVTYSLPLSTIRDTQASGWKISTLYVSLGLKYKLD